VPDYWLVNTGTTEQPWDGDLLGRYRAWNEREGDVQGFSRRPSGISVGDVLIHRAVGSPGNRLVAVGEVVGEPTDRPELRWRYRLPRRLTYVCPVLSEAPRAGEVGVDAHGVRTYKRLLPEAGRLAERAIVARGVLFA